MKVGFLLTLSGSVLGINCLIIGQCWWGVLLVGWFLVLLFCHFRTQFWRGILIFIICGGSFAYNELQWRQVPMEKQAQTQKLISHAEWYQIKAGYLRGYGFTKAGLGIEITGPVDRDIADKLRANQGNIELVVIGRLNKLVAASNRYGFDEANYWRIRNVTQQMKLDQVSLIDSKKGGSDRLLWLIRDIHYQLTKWFETMPGILSDYGQTLLLGHVPENFYQNNMEISTLGLVHLFSISGYQVTLLKRVWGSIARLFYLVREERLIIGQGIIFMLGVFAGEAHALVRAVVSGIVEHWCELHWINLHKKDVFGLSLMISLLLKPTLLLQLGGQLSFLLAWGLIWQKPGSATRTSFLLAILISPIIIWHTYSWTPISIIVNCFAIPIFSRVVIPLTVIGTIARIFDIKAFVMLTNDLLGYGQLALQIIAKFAGKIIFGQPPIAVVFAALIVGSFLLIRVRRLYFGLLVVIGLLAYSYQRLLPIGHVTFFDVGQGDATLIHRPYEGAILIDVGGRLQFGNRRRYQRNFDVEQMLKYLHAKGIDCLDHVALTHRDFDHVGNFTDLAKQIRINNIYIPAGMSWKKSYQGQQVHEVQAPQERDFGEFLYPFQIGTGRNEDSLVVRLQVGPQTLLAMGDLDRRGELAIKSAYPNLQANIIKLGHHGSKTSSARTFIKAIKPKIGVISAGFENRYGHPHLETLRTAKQAGLKLFSTANHGMIEYNWFGNFTWWEVKLSGSDTRYNKGRTWTK